MRVKRFVVSCLLAGSLLVAFVGGAGAEPAPQANCIGEKASASQGADVAQIARVSQPGQPSFVGILARNNGFGAVCFGGGGE